MTESKAAQELRVYGMASSGGIATTIESVLAELAAVTAALSFYAERGAWLTCEAHGRLTFNGGSVVHDGEPFMAFEKGEDHPWSVAEEALKGKHQ